MYKSVFRGALLLIVGAGLAVRLLTYGYSLPYIDGTNEPNKYLGAQEWRGLYDSGGYYDGYPPGYVVVHLGAQLLLERLGRPGMAETVGWLRLASVAADTLIIVLIALTVRLAAGTAVAVGRWAGLAAAALWASAPLVVENNVLALPDPLIGLLAAAAVWLAAHAVTDTRRAWWALASAALGLLATLFKYNALPLVAVGGAAALLIVVRRRATGLRLLAAQAALVGVVLGWLFFVYGIDVETVEREGAIIRESGVSNVLDPARALNNWYAAALPFMPGVVMGVIVGGVAAYGAVVVARVRARRAGGVPSAAPLLVDWRVVALALVPMLMAWAGAAYALATADYRMRDVLSASAGLAVVCGAALCQMVAAFAAPRQRVAAGVLLTLALVLVVIVPNSAGVQALIDDRSAPDRRVALRQWADINLEAGTVIVAPSDERVFNPIWGGIAGRQWFDWWESENPLDRSLEEWQTRGMSYLMIRDTRYEELSATDAGRAFFGQMLYLREFDFAPGRGPALRMYRLWQMQTPVAVTFGGGQAQESAIRLVGYDQSAERVRPGETLTLRFYWRADETPDGDYSLFVHLTALDDPAVLVQADGAPARPERPTLTWDVSEETIISQPFSLTVPDDAPLGRYRVQIGLYDYRTGARLPIAQQASDTLALTQIDVAAAEGGGDQT